MSPLLWLLLTIVVCTVTVSMLVRRLLQVIDKHVVHYLPSTTIARMSKELTSKLASTSTLEASLLQLVTHLRELETEMLRQISVSQLMHDSLHSLAAEQVAQWTHAHGPELMSSVIRSASSELSSRMERGLVNSVQKFGGEYVLLHSIPNASFRIQLEARYVDPDELRQALVRVLEWQPKKVQPIHSDRDRVQALLRRTESQRDLDQFLGSLGKTIQELRWEGSLFLTGGQQNGVA